MENVDFHNKTIQELQNQYWLDGSLRNGAAIELSITDPGILYGATLFTTMRIYSSLDHPLTQWREHCDRLHRSIDAFGWTLPNWDHLRQGAEVMRQRFPVLRMTIFPDGREWITGRDLPIDLQDRQQNGIVAWVVPEDLNRSLPNHKTGNYLAPWLALQTAKQHNAQEAILTNAQGDWLETSTGNLWGWKDGQWWTPELADSSHSEILPGLLRSRLISWLKCHNEEASEETLICRWNLDLVREFDAIAYSNCVMEVIPIHTVQLRDRQLTYDSAHPAFQILRNLFEVL